jgi:hypothetical protein
MQTLDEVCESAAALADALLKNGVNPPLTLTVDRQTATMLRAQRESERFTPDLTGTDRVGMLTILGVEVWMAKHEPPNQAAYIF